MILCQLMKLATILIYKKIIPETYNTNVWYNSWVTLLGCCVGGYIFKIKCPISLNKLFRFIARWNVEFLSGGAAKHEDPSDVNYVITSPAGYTMSKSVRGFALLQCSYSVVCTCIYEKQS